MDPESTSSDLLAAASECVDPRSQATAEEPSTTTANESKESQPAETSTQDHTEESESDDGEEDEGELSNKDRTYSPISLPMPDMTEFDVPLPLELQKVHEEEQMESVSDTTTRVLAPPPRVINVSEILKSLNSGDSEPSFEGVQIAHLGREAGLTGEMQATYLRLPPGTRTSRPVAQRLGDSITYCISGRGLLWQNGWSFPFETTDSVGWKGGTGIAHTIINDSNYDGSAGQDLILIVAHEVKEAESFFYPLNPEIDEDVLKAEGKSLWKDPPVQGELGPHPGVPSISAELGNRSVPEPQKGYRPSNAVNTIAELDAIGEGELFANATSLSQETGLSGRFGCNFEVPPPGTRSSDPHAHSLEDELVYVVSGSGLLWLNGHVQPVSEGDAVGFPGGTGVAHNFINDSNAEGEEGEPLILWIIGQNKIKAGDLVYYPLHTERKVTSKRWWADCPKYDLGPHNGRPKRPLRP